MKEFIDKLIERLEEAKAKAKLWDFGGVCLAIEIVNQLAEEYKNKVMIDGQYCWQTCSATEHCKECNRLCNGSIDYYENYDFMAEEYKVSEIPTGWITVSERLPSESGKYLVTTKNKTGWWILENNVFVCDYAYDTFVFQGWEDNEVIAWCELPAPYTEGEAELYRAKSVDGEYQEYKGDWK